MPGVNPPVGDQFFVRIADMERRLRAIETQQQSALTDSLGRPIINFGLVPGSDPPRYGIQVLDPTSGLEVAFIGEGSSGYGAALTLEGAASQIALQSGSTYVLYAGQAAIPDGSGRTQEVVLLSRDDGTVALELADTGTVLNHPHQQALQWLDRSGNIIIADDTTSGVGVARPHLQGPPLVNTNIGTWPATTAGTWATVAEAYMERQNPKLSWSISTYAPASTTGQFRLLAGNQQIGTTQTISNNNVGSWADTQPWPSVVPFGQLGLIALQAQVTAGTGSVAAQCFYLSGTQT